MPYEISEASDPESYLLGMRAAISIGLDKPYGITVTDAQLRAYNKIMMKREQETRANAPDPS